MYRHTKLLVTRHWLSLNNRKGSYKLDAVKLLDSRVKSFLHKHWRIWNKNTRRRLFSRHEKVEYLREVVKNVFIRKSFHKLSVLFRRRQKVPPMIKEPKRSGISLGLDIALDGVSELSTRRASERATDKLLESTDRSIVTHSLKSVTSSKKVLKVIGYVQLRHKSLFFSNISSFKFKDRMLLGCINLVMKSSLQNTKLHVFAILKSNFYLKNLKIQAIRSIARKFNKALLRSSFWNVHNFSVLWGNREVMMNESIQRLVLSKFKLGFRKINEFICREEKKIKTFQDAVRRIKSYRSFVVKNKFLSWKFANKEENCAPRLVLVVKNIVVRRQKLLAHRFWASCLLRIQQKASALSTMSFFFRKRLKRVLIKFHKDSYR